MPHDARTFRSDTHESLLMNGSCDTRHATATAGKLPQSLPGPNRDEPSRRTLNDAR